MSANVAAMADTPQGRVLLAYDGSKFARTAIEQAGRELRPGREAVILTIWQPLETLPFYSSGVAVGPSLDEGMDEGARRTADEGADLAAQAGFETRIRVERGAPVWARIVEVADDEDVSLIVLGSHGRSALGRAMMGSVAAAVVNGTRRSVFIVHRPE